jgi:hypothetical protein
MIRLVLLAVVVLLAVAVLSFIVIAVSAARARVRGRVPRPAPKQRDYDWERRRDQVYRRIKAVPGPQEDRDRIIAFLDSRRGVDAFVEPRTVIHPLSVVLVAEDGEWIRIELREDAFLRELSRTRGLRIHDATRVGYPERMRNYRRPGGAQGKEPGADA